MFVSSPPAVDFGIAMLQKHMQSFRFPWLLSNVLDARTGEPLGGADRSRIIEWQGVRVGLMGLVEPEVRWHAAPTCTPACLQWTAACLLALFAVQSSACSAAVGQLPSV
jgi:hypothetical protein